MTTQALIEAMEKLLDLHNELLQTANEKTTALKDNNIEQLTKILRTEQKIAASIQITNSKRQQVAEFLTKGNKEVTISDIIEMLEGQEREELQQLQEALSAVLAQLKDVNELNQQLLKLSLQFIHLNLDLMAPELDNANYTKTRDEMNDQPSPGRSIFDSKA
ncbi:flagellar protein FlgN [Lederbergia panacisoli]|uniref:flagellar protein FlgN n=1 Tax=Lederbergia panacisoli TaxID=1255251 RepID=UPI00214C3B93|nr:flagellar protein FlgN [Lederbergia panacisoli]MCR2822358.1 flagellar protein FlgN [Lederbergia panacisoli]